MVSSRGPRGKGRTPAILKLLRPNLIKAGIIKENNPKQNFNDAIAKMKTDAEL